MIKWFPIFFPIFLLMVLIAGCDSTLPAVGNRVREGVDKIRVFFSSLVSKNNPANNPAVKPTAVPDATNESERQATARAHQEWISEMLRVVFNERQITDKNEFGSLVASLNQGASLEGIYRGLISGQRYRALENTGRAASPVILKRFSVEMTALQAEMKTPSDFKAGVANKPAEIDFPDGTESELEFDRASEKNLNSAQRSARFQKMFLGTSVFILKRLLAEEVLLKIAEVKEDAQDFPQWYAQWVIRTNSWGIDFGLPQRNRTDFDLHAQFAKTFSLDRVQWEALNRVHRALNE